MNKTKKERRDMLFRKLTILGAGHIKETKKPVVDNNAAKKCDLIGQCKVVCAQENPDHCRIKKFYDKYPNRKVANLDKQLSLVFQ